MSANDKVVRLNADGSCEAVPLAAYPVVTSPDTTINVTPVTDSATGKITYQIKLPDECQTFGNAPTDFETFRIFGCDANGKGSALICQILGNIPTGTGFAGG